MGNGGTISGPSIGSVHRTHGAPEDRANIQNRNVYIGGEDRGFAGREAFTKAPLHDTTDLSPLDSGESPGRIPRRITRYLGAPNDRWALRTRDRAEYRQSKIEKVRLPQGKSEDRGFAGREAPFLTSLHDTTHLKIVRCAVRSEYSEVTRLTG